MSDELRDEWVRAVEVENDQLRERILVLERQLGLTFDCPPCLGLTGSEGRLLGLLMHRDVVTKESAMIGLYGNRPDADVVEITIIDVYVCKLRKKLAPFGIKIETQWGRGYWMAAQCKAAVQALMPEKVDVKGAA